MILLMKLVGFASVAIVARASQSPKYLYKDVVIVGGGASGAHAAVRLRDDYHKSIALIEKRNILGGHVDSFTDPDTGATRDYGVQTFLDAGDARGFFSRFGIEVTTSNRYPTTTRYVDFSSGAAVNFTPPAIAPQMEALATYRDLCEQYEDILQPGYWEFPLPEDIPADLLLPYGEFITKYGVEAAMPFIYRSTGLGVGDIVNELTLYVMQTFGASMARALLGEQAQLVPQSGRNQDIYDAIGETLGDDMLYSSVVIDSSRKSENVSVTVQNTETKEVTIINARHLLMAIEPTEANLQPFHTDEQEKAVFSKFIGSRAYAGIVSNEALPVNFSLFNIPAAAAPSDLLTYAPLPFTARFDYSGLGKYFRILIIGREDLQPDEAKTLAQNDFEKLIDAGILFEPANRELTWNAFEDHGATHLRVSEEELKAGFIQKQYALQGRRGTWWTGGAFSVHFQTTLWEYNDILLEKMAAEL